MKRQSIVPATTGESIAHTTRTGRVTPIRLYVVKPLSAGLVVCELSAHDRRRSRRALKLTRLADVTVSHRYSLQTVTGIAIAGADDIATLEDLAVELTARCEPLASVAIDPDTERAASRFKAWKESNLATAQEIGARIGAY